MTSLPLITSKTAHGHLRSLRRHIEVANDGIGELAGHLKVFLKAERMVVYVIDRPAVDDASNSVKRRGGAPG
jgi:hypothetical protein